jgi:co-chaperonin GroES (HSP10)
MLEVFVAKNYVLLRPVGEAKTKSGILIPDAQDKKPEMGIVYKVGEGKQPFSVPLKKGDRVLYKKYMSNEMDITDIGEKVNPIAFEDLVALFREKDE